MKLQITYPFTVSKNGSYKRYHRNMVAVMNYIQRTWTEIVSHFDIKRDVEIRLRPLPNRRSLGNHRTKGKFDQGDHYIQLDCSKSLRTIIHTLFHELQHAEQIEQGRLKHVFVGKWQWVWNNVNHGRNCGFGQTTQQLDRYRSQPWEKDANDKADIELARHEAQFGRLPTTITI